MAEYSDASTPMTGGPFGSGDGADSAPKRLMGSMRMTMPRTSSTRCTVGSDSMGNLCIQRVHTALTGHETKIRAAAPTDTRNAVI